MYETFVYRIKYIPINIKERSTLKQNAMNIGIIFIFVNNFVIVVRENMEAKFWSIDIVVVVYSEVVFVMYNIGFRSVANSVDIRIVCDVLSEIYMIYKWDVV